MKRLIAALTSALILVACTNSSPASNHVELEPECRYHGKLQETGCIYEVAELTRLTGRKDYPVWVYQGVPQKDGDGYLLQISNESTAPFIVLEVSAYPVTAAELGLAPLVGWKTGIVGRYTSSDIADPSVTGASGTLEAVDIGWLRDSDRPLGPYENFRSELAEKFENAKAPD